MIRWHGTDGLGFVIFLTCLAAFWLIVDGVSRGWLIP
jgi:hypothetical protein